MEQLELDLADATREIKEKLNTVAENFVFVGYRLRQILETGVFADAGYTNIFDYAEKELSLNVTAVSRFIAINKKYSVGGYGPELKEQYKGYGSSKLSEMLTMADEDCAVIGAETSVKQIREYKSFLKDEPKEDDGQMHLMEEKKGSSGGLKKLLINYFQGNMDMLRRVLDDTATAEILQEQMNPTGVHNIKYKTAFLMLKDLEHGVMYREFGKAPENMTWEELLNRIRTELEPEYETMAEHEKKQKEEEKDQKKEEREKEQKKSEKVQEKAVATSQTGEQQEVVEKEQGNVETEEQIPGQMEVNDYPEMLPDEKKESIESTLTEEKKEIEEKPEENKAKGEEETEKNGVEDEELTVKRLDLTMAASELYGAVQKMDYEAAVGKCENLLILLKRKVHEDEKEQTDESDNI